VGGGGLGACNIMDRSRLKLPGKKGGGIRRGEGKISYALGGNWLRGCIEGDLNDGHFG